MNAAVPPPSANPGTGPWDRAPAPLPASVPGDLVYLVDDGRRPATYIPAPGTGEMRRTGTYAPYRVEIANGRLLAGAPSLEREGFALVRHDAGFATFDDTEALRALYYPEMERLVRRATGAARVLAFDHNLRIDGSEEVNDHGTRTPVRYVHNDYTETSGPQRVRDLLPPEEAAARLRKRFAMINVWRPVAGPVQTAPLALADAQSIAAGDLKELDLVYSDRTGEIYNAVYSPGHRWYYFPRLPTDEAILIKCYDSLADGRARFTLHSAFDDPTSPPGAAPRQSVEVRTIAFFDA